MNKDPFAKLAKERNALYKQLSKELGGNIQNWAEIIHKMNAGQVVIAVTTTFTEKQQARLADWSARWDALTKKLEAQRNKPEEKAKAMLKDASPELREALMYELTKDGCFHG